jgi:hypothetical protein
MVGTQALDQGREDRVVVRETRQTQQRRLAPAYLLVEDPNST